MLSIDFTAQKSSKIMNQIDDLFTSQISKVFKFTQHCLHCTEKLKYHKPIGEKINVVGFARNEFWKIPIYKQAEEE